MGELGHAAENFFYGELDRLSRAVADLLELAAEQYNTNEQLQRDVGILSEDLQRISGKQERVRASLGELYSAHFRQIKKTNRRLTKVESSLASLNEQMARLTIE